MNSFQLIIIVVIVLLIYVLFNLSNTLQISNENDPQISVQNDQNITQSSNDNQENAGKFNLDDILFPDNKTRTDGLKSHFVSAHISIIKKIMEDKEFEKYGKIVPDSTLVISGVASTCHATLLYDIKNLENVDNMLKQKYNLNIGLKRD